MAILIDFSQTVIAAICAGAKADFAGAYSQEDTAMNATRHIVLNILQSYRKKYNKEYGELVICCDGQKVWRKRYFKHYKAARQSGREASAINWDMVFKSMDLMIYELEEHFPYKVVRCIGAEGDDIIAVLAKKFAKAKERCMIISTDKDFRQLQCFAPFISQFSPMQRMKLVENDPVGYRFELICKGDKADGVPNIFSPDDAFVNNIRQNACTKKKLNELRPTFDLFFKSNDVKVFDMLYDDTLAERIRTNIMMIDLVSDQIPPDIVETIENVYNLSVVHSRQKLHKYFIEHQLKNLLPRIGNF